MAVETRQEAQEATVPNRVNGVDTGRLYQTVSVIQGQPELANFRFRAKHEWVDGGHGRTTIHDFYGAGKEDRHQQRFVFEADEPDVLLGTDRGANATEAALHALASCLTASFIYHAAARNISIDSLECDLEGDLDLHGFLGLSDEIRRGFQQVRVSFRVEADITEAQLEECCRLAQKQSPVFDIFTNRVSVEVRCARR
jgi:uncharacterized OsmC-like protein